MSLQELADILIDVAAAGTDVADHERTLLTEEILGGFRPLQKPSGCQPHETVAVAAARLKTAALFFDRVWHLPGTSHVPPEIVAWGGTDVELALIWLLRVDAGKDPVAKQRILDKFAQTTIGKSMRRNDIPERQLSELLAEQRRWNAIPVYASITECRDDYQPGRYDVIIAALTEVPLPDDASLQWEQVMEFRRDRESRCAYRRFVRWLDRDLIGQSSQVIADTVVERLEAYELALRKHGVSTVAATIESILDPRMLAAAAGLAAGGAVFGQSLVGLLAGAGAVLAKASCTAAHAALDLKEIKRNYAEVAFVHEVQRVSTTKSAG